MLKDMPECAKAGISTLVSVKRDWLSLDSYPWRTTMSKGVSLVKLIEPPCTERYARWCERSVGEIIAYLLLDYMRLSETALTNIREKRIMVRVGKEDEGT